MKRFCLIVVASAMALCSFACGSGQIQVVVTIVPDLFPHETSWSLHDGNTNALIDTGTYNGDTICIGALQCVRFTIYDSYGDGMCCNYGQGHYSVSLNGIMIDSGGQFNSFQYAYFNCPIGFDCAEPFNAGADTMTAPHPESWYVFSPDSTGLYDIKTCDLGNLCEPKIYIYDHCAGISIFENNLGTTFYADTNCANGQALITGFMRGGQVYYIRIGENGNSCSGDSIRWMIKYNGPIVGCMDVNSCNYNPLASVSDSSCLYWPSPLCPAPDLMVVQDDLTNSLYSDSINVGAVNCYVGEGCLAGYGTRSLIRFTTHVRNVGNQDFFIGAPDTTGGAFVYDQCHQHWHYVGYAEYLMFDSRNQPVQVGFKNGFCVEDLECDSIAWAKYSCSNMGITTGCGDVYSAGLPCQWIDITDVDTGDYTLLVGVNWNHKPDKLGHYERTYDNNWAQVCFNIHYNSSNFKTFSLLPLCLPYTDCAGDTFGSKSLDCKGVCNGSTVRGDINGDFVADSTDIGLYLDGIVQDTISVSPCDDLNGDDLITVTDAVRLSGCILYNEGLYHTASNYQNTHKHCEFPFNIINPLDTMIFSIANVDWGQRYIDVSVYNPTGYLLAFEMRLHGLVVDSISNLVSGYSPITRSSSAGHIAGIALDGNALVKQLSPLDFLRVYYSALADTQICIQQIVSISNGNYEEAKGIVGMGCVSPSIVITSLASIFADDVSIVPNPSCGLFNVFALNHSLLGSDISISDTRGRTVQSFKSADIGNVKIDLSDKTQGIYFLNIRLNGQNIFKRMVLTGR